MTEIRPISETEESVTLARADWESLLEELEDAQDLAAVRASAERDAAGENEYLPIEMVKRLVVERESPIRVWREHRGMSGRELAAAASVRPSYLSELEAGTKTGSLHTLVRIAEALQVDLADLVMPWPQNDERQ